MRKDQCLVICWGGPFDLINSKKKLSRTLTNQPVREGSMRVSQVWQTLLGASPNLFSITSLLKNSDFFLSNIHCYPMKRFFLKLSFQSAYDLVSFCQWAEQREQCARFRKSALWKEVYCFLSLLPFTCLEWGYNGKTQAAILDQEVASRMEAAHPTQQNKGSFLILLGIHTSSGSPYLQVSFRWKKERDRDRGREWEKSHLADITFQDTVTCCQTSAPSLFPLRNVHQLPELSPLPGHPGLSQGDSEQSA